MMIYGTKKRWLFLSLIVLFFFTLYIFFYCVYNVDHAGYQELEDASHPTDAREKQITGSEKTEKVSKTFWQSKNSARLCMNLQYDHGDLTYRKEKGKESLSETMNDGLGVFQERLFISGGPKQTVGFFSFENANYLYKTGRLEAKKVDVQFYTLDGHLCPRPAEKIDQPAEMSLQADLLERIDNRLSMQGHVEIATEQFRTKSNQAIYEGQTLTLTDAVELEIDWNLPTKISCKEAKIILGSEEKRVAIEQMVLHGNVSIVNRGGSILQYVLADEAAYDHKNKTMHLSAEAPERVLFYDKMNDFKVSAPEVVMNLATNSGMPDVRGIGNVRFQFAEREYDKFKKTLGKEWTHGGK